MARTIARVSASRVQHREVQRNSMGPSVADASGARLSFEINLDQSDGETSTARKILEALLAIPPEAQASLSVTREATVLG